MSHLSVTDISSLINYIHDTDTQNKIKTYSDFLDAQTLSSSSIFAQFLADRYTIAKFYERIPQAANIPRTFDFESAMNDDLIKNTRSNIALLSENTKIKDEAHLEGIETEIRKTLLLAIRDEGEENQDFINQHLDALAKRSDNDLIQQAADRFSDTQSIAQTAWRAYEPTAACVVWPNLLTKPSRKNAVNHVFATTVSIANTPLENKHVTLASASEDIRRLAARIFLEIQNKNLSPEARKKLEQDFVSYLAEIRRAHNLRQNEIDNPSCYPGCISRLGQILNAHPSFRKAENQEAIPSIVSRVVLEKMQQELAKRSSEAAPETMRLLLSAICLYGPRSIEQLAAGYDGLAYNLHYYEEDLNSDGVKQYAEEALSLRREFLNRVCDTLFDAIDERVRQIDHDADSETVNYLIAQYLFASTNQLSWPEALLQSYREASSMSVDVKTTLVEETKGVWEGRLKRALPLLSEDEVNEFLCVLFKRIPLNATEDELDKKLEENLNCIRENNNDLYRDENSILRILQKTPVKETEGDREDSSFKYSIRYGPTTFAGQSSNSAVTPSDVQLTP